MDETLLLKTNMAEEYQITQFLGLFKYGSPYYIWYVFNRYNILLANNLIPPQTDSKFQKAFILKRTNTKLFTNKLNDIEIKEIIEKQIIENNLDVTSEHIIEEINNEIMFPTIKYPFEYVFSTNNNLSHVNTLFQGIGNGSKRMKVFIHDKYVVCNRPFVSNNDISLMLLRCLSYGYLQINGSYIELTEKGNTYISILTANYDKTEYFAITRAVCRYVGMQNIAGNPYVNRMFQILRSGPMDYYDIANHFGPKNDFDYHFVSKRLQTYVYQNESENVFSISTRTFYRQADDIIYDILKTLFKYGWVQTVTKPYTYKYNNTEFTLKEDVKYVLTKEGVSFAEKADTAIQNMPLNLVPLIENNEDYIFLMLRRCTILYIMCSYKEEGIDIVSLCDEVNKMGYDENIYTIINDVDDLIRSGFHVTRELTYCSVYNTVFDEKLFLSYFKKMKEKGLLQNKSTTLLKKEKLYQSFLFMDKSYLSVINLANLSSNTNRRISERNYLMKILLTEMLNQNNINAECFFLKDEPDILLEIKGHKVIADISACRDDKDNIIDIDRIFSLYMDETSNWNQCFDFNDETIVIFIVNDMESVKEQNVLNRFIEKVREADRKLYCGMVVTLEDILSFVNVIHDNPSILRITSIREPQYVVLKGERVYD